MRPSADSEPDRRLLVALAPAGRIDPLAIGVRPAVLPAGTGPLGGALPRYVARDVDAVLRDAVDAALRGHGNPIVIAAGPAASGKSRALLRALCASAVGAQATVIAPVDADAVRTAGAQDAAVLWLADLEPFVNGGVTLQILRAWVVGGPRRAVLAGYGGRDGWPALITRGLPSLAAQILNGATVVEVGPLKGAIADSHAVGLPAGARPAMARLGLGAYLAGADELDAKLREGRGAGTGSDERGSCLEGVTVVAAAVDWARCGRTDPIAADDLRALWREHLPGGLEPSEALFESGLRWALEPCASSVALLAAAAGARRSGSAGGPSGPGGLPSASGAQRSGSGGYLVHDLVVAGTRGQPAAPPPREQTWSRAVLAEAAQALAVGVVARLHGRREDAVAAFARASSDADPQVACLAGLNGGVVLGELGRWGEALAVWERAVEALDRIRDAGEVAEPALRGAAAAALFNTGAQLDAAGRHDEAIAAFAGLVARFDGAAEPLLREAVATALLFQARGWEALERFDEAIAAFDGLVARFAQATEPPLREAVAGALFSKGARLDALGHPERAMLAYAELSELFAGAREPELRVYVARALVNRGVDLDTLGRSREAIDVYTRVAELLGDAADAGGGDEPAATGADLRAQAATALVNKGVRLGVLGRSREALDVFESVVRRFGESAEPAPREAVAKALLNTGLRLTELGRPDEAIAAYDAILARFAEAGEAPLREAVATALDNKGAALKGLGRADEAVAAYEQMLAQFVSASDPALRQAVATALVEQALAAGSTTETS